MMVVRPARLSDLDALLNFAIIAGEGLTTLPHDERLVRQRIEASLHALSHPAHRPGGQAYLFVMEDVITGQAVGCAGIVAQVGGFEPFYAYRVEHMVHTSPELGVSTQLDVLHLLASHKGPTEIGTLFLTPAARGGGNGRLLSLSRFLFMAAFPERFSTRVIAEMRGVLDARGQSPFWEAVGRHFFGIDFGQADDLSAADKGFIADLMPKHPLYIAMLPTAVQAVIGEVHQETRPALRLLEQEGFRFADQVDIFDAGPVVQAEVSALRAIRESRVGVLTHVSPDCSKASNLLISNARDDFRACLGCLERLEGDEVAVPRDVALALGLHLGDALRYTPARA